jgi:hypothetical protein
VDLPWSEDEQRPGKDAVQAKIRIPAVRLGKPRPCDPARPSLVENTAAAVTAQLERRVMSGPWLQVELMEHPVMTSPLTGKAMRSPPAAVMWQGTRPIAVLIGQVLALNATAPRCIRDALIAEARRRALAFQHVREQQLHRLLPEQRAEARVELAA